MRLTLPVRAAGLALLLSPVLAGAQRTRNPLAPLDAYVAATMRQWKVPGIAIAIVKDDSVVLSKGYGVRTLGQPAPVDANTVFAIGSSSKAFTAALVAMAVDEGKMRWDDPVSAHLPGFQLNDTYASRGLTVRDALSHRSGLARGDLMWYAAGLGRDEILRRVRYLEPSWGFRAQFGYQNIMFLAAGQAVARAGGASWDDLIRTRIFEPLAMTGATTSVTALAGRANVSSPHGELDDTVRVIPWKNIDNIAPAGSINASVADMTRWLRLQLGKGTIGGRQLISAPAVDQMWTPNIAIRLEGPTARFLAPGANLSSYGMGWFLQDFNGRLAVHHGGNIDGFSAMVAMLPGERLGVVILTNANGSPAPEVLFPYVFDLYTRDTPHDWNTDFEKIVGGARKAAAAAESALVKSRVAATKPSLPLERYAGTFADSMYGDLTVTHRDGALRMQLGIFAGRLEHWHYDSFRAVMDNRQFGRMMATFTLDAGGKPAEARLEAMPEAKFRFTPPKADTTAAVALSTAQLSRFTGKFRADLAPLDVEVSLVGGELKLTVPGQPQYTLVAASATRFRLTLPAGMPEGFYMNYTLTGDAVTGATLEQPSPRPSLKLTKLP